MFPHRKVLKSVHTTCITLFMFSMREYNSYAVSGLDIRLGVGDRRFESHSEVANIFFFIMNSPSPRNKPPWPLETATQVRGSFSRTLRKTAFEQLEVANTVRQMTAAQGKY